jgi:hypothetical protein
MAGAIQRGDLGAYALVHFIGDGRIVKEKGTDIAMRAEVDEFIEHLEHKMQPDFHVDPDKYMAKSTLTLGEISNLLSDLPEDARNMFASMLPKSVLQKTGLSDEQIKEMNKAAKQDFAESLGAILQDIASMPKEKLEQARLEPKEIRAIEEGADNAKRGDFKAVMAAVSVKGQFEQGVEFDALNVKDYWKRLAAGDFEIGELHRKNERAQEAEAEKEAETRKKDKAQKSDAKIGAEDKESRKSFAERVGDAGKEHAQKHMEKAKRSLSRVSDEQEERDREEEDIPGHHVSESRHLGGTRVERHTQHALH